MKAGFALAIAFNFLAIAFLVVVTVSDGNGAASQTGFVPKLYLPPEQSALRLRPVPGPGESGDEVDRTATSVREREAAASLQRRHDETVARFRPAELLPPWEVAPDGKVELRP